MFTPLGACSEVPSRIKAVPQGESLERVSMCVLCFLDSLSWRHVQQASKSFSFSLIAEEWVTKFEQRGIARYVCLLLTGQIMYLPLQNSASDLPPCIPSVLATTALCDVRRRDRILIMGHQFGLDAHLNSYAKVTIP